MRFSPPAYISFVVLVLLAAVLLIVGLLSGANWLALLFSSLLGLGAALLVGGVVITRVFLMRDRSGFTPFNYFWFKFGSTSMGTSISANMPLVAGAASTLATAALIGVAVLLYSGRSQDAPVEIVQRAPVTPTPAVTALSPQSPVQFFNGPIAVDVLRFSDFAWPAPGQLVASFGSGDPTGISIALDATRDVPIWASARGVVASAGDTGAGNGLTVVLDHGDGTSTLYSHLGLLLVSSGQRVEKGQSLGLGGSSGGVRGKQLHFEVRRAGSPVDPMSYLPSTQFGISYPLSDLRYCPAAIPVDASSEVILTFMADSLTYYKVEQVTVAQQSPGSEAPVLAARPKGLSGVTLDVPALTRGGQVLEYGLDVTFVKGSERLGISCRIAVAAATAVPLLPVTEAAAPAANDDSTNPDGSPAPADGSTPAGDDASAPPSASATPAPSKTPTKTASPAAPKTTPTPNWRDSAGPAATPVASSTPKPAATPVRR